MAVLLSSFNHIFHFAELFLLYADRKAEGYADYHTIRANVRCASDSNEI